MSPSLKAFAGRVAVVTGVGSGIGRALTYQLAARGAVLAISDINDPQLAVTAQHARSLGATVRADHLDVTDRPAMLSYAEEIAAYFGVVHLVINNAGVAHVGDVLGMRFSDIERVMDTNFWGVVNGTMAFLPHLIASGDGHLVNISSLFGLIPVPTQSAYVASKFAVRGFTESLRIEMLAAKMPVRVTRVHPGGVNTAIARSGTRNAGALREGDSGPGRPEAPAHAARESRHHHLARHVPRPSTRARWAGCAGCLPPKFAQQDRLAESHRTRLRSHVCAEIGAWLNRPHLNLAVDHVKIKSRPEAQPLSVPLEGGLADKWPGRSLAVTVF